VKQAIALLGIGIFFPIGDFLFSELRKLLIKCCAALKCCLFIVGPLRKWRLINYLKISECDLLGTALFSFPQRTNRRVSAPACRPIPARATHTFTCRDGWTEPTTDRCDPFHHTHTHTNFFSFFFWQALHND